MSKRNRRKGDKYKRDRRHTWGEYNQVEAIGKALDPSEAVKRGIESENRVCEVLEPFKEDGIIQGYRKVRRYSKLDRRGIDIIIFIADGHRAYIQVKSSLDAARFADKAYRMYHKGRVHTVNGFSPNLSDWIANIIQQEIKNM